MIQPSEYNSKHQGKRGFVVGGGPSILQLINKGFSFNSLDNEIVVAVNQSYKLGKPNYIVSLDPGFCGKRNVGKFPKDSDLRFVFPQWVNETPETRERIIRVHMQENLTGIPQELTTHMPYVSNSGAFGIVIAYLLGLNPLYLIGFDGVKLDGKSHFHTDYGNWYLNDGQIHSFFNKHLKVVEVLKNRGITSYSCSSASLLNQTIEYKNILEVIHSVS